jgi:hypothetical protein
VESGTKIVFEDIDPEVWDALNVKTLANRLQQRYGPYLRDGARIFIVRNGRVEEVKPPEEQGIVLVSKTLYLSGGKGPFQVEFRWIPEKSGTRGIMLRFAGTESPLKKIPGFDQEPFFNRPDISGYVNFPDLPPPPAGAIIRADEVQYLDLVTDKSDIKEGAVRRQWMKAINNLVAAAQEELKLLEERLRDQRVEGLGSLLVAATTEVLLADEELAGLVRSLPVRPRKPQPRGKNTGVISQQDLHEGIEVVIYNQWKRRTRQSVSVHLSGTSKKREQTDIILSTRNGSLVFSMPPPGRYEVKLVDRALPKDARVVSTARYVVNVEEDKPQPMLIFNLETTEKMPNPGEKLRLAFWFHPWPDPRQPWRTDSLGEYGRFEVNTAGRDLRTALESDDIDAVLRLLALYVASGLCKHIYRNEPDIDVPLEISLLAPKLERSFRMNYAQKRRGKSKAKGVKR